MTLRISSVSILKTKSASASKLALMAGAAIFGFGAAAHADTVRVTIPEYSPQTSPYFKQAADAFEKLHPDTKIELEVVPWPSLQQKLVTDISGGVNADLAIIGTRWILDYAKQDVVEPLDGYMDDAFKARFFPAFLTPSVVNNVTFGLPIAASARAMFYNKDILKEAGFDEPPATWDDVLKVSRAIKALGKDGVSAYGIQGKSTETDVYFYYPMWSYGGDILTKDGKSGINSEAGLKALDLYTTMIKEGLTEPGATDLERLNIEDLFKQGKLGMVITGPFLSKQLSTQAKNLKYGIAKVPSGTTTATYGVTDSIIMFKNSKVKKDAWAFLDFLFSTDQRVKFDEAEGFLPVNKAEAATPEFADNADLKIFTSLLEGAHFAPLVSGWEQIADQTISGLQAAYLGKAEPAAALKDIEAKVNDILSQ